MANVTAADTPENFLKSMENFELTTYKNINFIIKAVASQLFEDVIRDTPVRSGRARNNWIFSSGTTPKYADVGPKKITKKNTTSFDITGEAAIKKMENGLRRAPSMIKKKQFVLEYYLTNQVPYINLLEYGGYPSGPNVTNGYSPQAPAGMARKNTQKYSKYTLTHVSKLKGTL